jgi:hypothetical protein
LTICITPSLAGRTAFVELFPFSLQELAHTGKLPATADIMLLTGGYPPLYDWDLPSQILDIRARSKLSRFSTASPPRQFQQAVGQDAEAIFLRRWARLVAIEDQDAGTDGDSSVKGQYFLRRLLFQN